MNMKQQKVVRTPMHACPKLQWCCCRTDQSAETGAGRISQSYQRQRAKVVNGLWKIAQRSSDIFFSNRGNLHHHRRLRCQFEFRRWYRIALVLVAKWKRRISAPISKDTQEK